jgi:hypothetical protein
MIIKTGYLSRILVSREKTVMNGLGQKRIVFWILAALIWVGCSTAARGGPHKKTPSELELARVNLRVSEATEARIATELEQLKTSGEASPEVIEEYETYLRRVQAITEENRRVVREMEAVYARHRPGETSTDQKASRETAEMGDPPIQEEQTVDEVAALDREFNKSLAEFDEMLLAELDAIRIESSERMRDLAEEAAEAARRLREKGIDLDTSLPPGACSEGEEGGKAGEGEAQPGKEATGGEGQTESSSAGQGEGAGEKEADAGGEGAEAESGLGPSGRAEAGRESGETKSGTGQEGTDEEEGRDTRGGSGYGQVGGGGESHDAGRGPRREQDRGYAEDDDIVARQLREAAESETDPELRERLWREYEEYKKSL